MADEASGNQAGSRSLGPVSHALVRAAHRHRRRAAELLRQVDLHPGQELLLMLLWERDHRPQAELVSLLGVEAPTVTKTLQRMEDQGLVARQRPATNQRIILVSLTDKGRGRREDVQRIWATLEESATRGLTEAERAQLCQLLYRLEENLGEADGPSSSEQGRREATGLPK